MSNRLEGRRVLVVGGGSQAVGDEDAPPSNGQAISVLAARQGAGVAVADINADAAAETARLIAQDGGGETVRIVANVREPGDCERLVDEAMKGLGGLDGLVLNVGIGAAQGLGVAGTDAKAWDLVLDVNLRSHFLIARHALPKLADGASIVFISSLAGLRPGSFLPAYDTSKAGLIGLCRHVALEGARAGVRANVVAPGLIDTPLGRQASGARPGRERTRIPLGRQGTAWEVAQTVTFLLSGEASYTTAQTLVVDGGLTLM
jgi:NAD(P)-dependent dehydrogenase (short-subunit alcohol dehydrogenase family)